MGTKQNLYAQVGHKIPQKQFEMFKFLIKILYKAYLAYQVAYIMFPNKHNSSGYKPL